MSIFTPTPEIIAYLKTHFSNTPGSASDSNASSASDTIDIVTFSPSQHSHLVPSFSDIHVDCIHTDHTIATFTTPIDAAKKERMLAWWGERVKEVEKGDRIIFMALARPVVSDPSAAQSFSATDAVATATKPQQQQPLHEGKEVAGYVMLSKPTTETGPFRGLVEKLLVSPRFRRRGIARMLMERLEVVAREQGRWLLLLDTETGSPAEIVYAKLGFTELGKIPNYGISPLDHSLIAGTFFWKDVRARDGTAAAANAQAAVPASANDAGSTASTAATVTVGMAKQL